MARIKLYRNRAALYISIFADMALVLGLAAPALSQSGLASQPVAQITPYDLKISVTFEPPPDQGAPAGTAGGASRGGCPSDPKEKPFLTALIPATGKVLTVAERPTLFFYIPQTSARKVGFSLKDENENDVYQTDLEISGNPGIVSVSLPPSAPALEIGKNYNWYFALVCNSADASGNLVVNGSLERSEISPTLAKAQELTSPLERAAFYAKNGIWLEALANLAEVRRQEPDNTKLAEQWAEFLKSAGLEPVAEKPLLKPK
ncbi:MAG: DUF928 domain-containing protein [Oscillatoria sp. Prado101]|nr:DUF928 domain-containing protein [Oscillatoria sp. Prado101]